MKTKLLILFLLCVTIQANAQCGGPPPPAGLSYVYALDTDNDGYATFDMDYYIAYVERPLQESGHGVSSSGYDFIFKNMGGMLLPLQYTNTVLNESCIIEFVYTGNGPTFDPVPPCYWPVLLASSIRLIPVPYDLDMDNDGILNEDEDSNHNLNLMDDDDDHDGEINLKDAVNNMGIHDNQNIGLTIYPNPVTNGMLTFESSIAITAVTVYDLSGKQLMDIRISSDTVRVDALATGIYLIKFQSDNDSIFRKVAIN
jgi:hypothetical protein